MDIEQEEECGIFMEMNSKIVLPNCNHAMYLICYQEWYAYYSLSHACTHLHHYLSFYLPWMNDGIMN